jgi:putative transposase
MARLPRLVVPHQPHHILQSGHDGQPIFRDGDDYARFLAWLKESAKEFKVAIHAYALMPDHMHLLATPATPNGLAQAMQRVGRYYVPWFNSKYGRSGSLFQGRFKTALVDAASFLLPCSRYIELNPVRSALCGEPEGYAWSSYRHHAGIEANAMITDHAVYWALGNTPFQREAAYIEHVRQGIGSKELALINAATLKGWPLGSDAFKSALQAKEKRQVLQAKRGRPFKVKSPAEAI